MAESGYGVGLAYAAGCDEGGCQGTGANALRLIGSVGEATKGASSPTGDVGNR